MSIREYIVPLFVAVAAHAIPAGAIAPADGHLPCEHRVLTTTTEEAVLSTPLVVATTLPPLPTEAAAPPPPPAPIVHGVPIPEPIVPSVAPVVAPVAPVAPVVAPVAPVAPVVAPVAPVVAPVAPVADVGANTVSFGSNDYTHYASATQWKTFEELFPLFRPTMLAVGSTGGAIDRMRPSILKHAAKYGIEARLILAIIMAESRGNVGEGGSKMDNQDTPGLMQAMGCPACPGHYDATTAEIDAMIDCGTAHFKGDWDGQAGVPYQAQVYHAMRSYNSGARGVDKSNLDAIGGWGDPLYIQHIAGYLTGTKTN